MMSSTDGLEQMPIMAKIIVGLTCAVAFTIYAYWSIKVTRRRYSVALQRMRERTPLPDVAFARELGLDSDTSDAAIAIGVRQALAEWLHIPAASITPATSFEREPDLRTLGDSLSVMEFVLLLQERANLYIPNCVLSALPSPFHKASVGETIKSILDLIVRPPQGMKLTIRIKQREENRWLARVPEIYGLIVHARSREEAIARAKGAALLKLGGKLGRIVPQTVVTFSLEEQKTRNEFAYLVQHYLRSKK